MDSTDSLSEIVLRLNLKLNVVLKRLVLQKLLKMKPVKFPLFSAMGVYSEGEKMKWLNLATFLSCLVNLCCNFELCLFLFCSFSPACRRLRL